MPGQVLRAHSHGRATACGLHVWIGLLGQWTSAQRRQHSESPRRDDMAKGSGRGVAHRARSILTGSVESVDLPPNKSLEHSREP